MSRCEPLPGQNWGRAAWFIVSSTGRLATPRARRQLSRATNTAALQTARGQAGTAQFTHDGPPGAILTEAVVANFTLTPPYVQPVRFKPPREAR